MAKLAYIDPNGAKWRRKFLVPLFNNKYGYWYLTKIAPKVDATLTPLTRGWVSSAPATSLLLMTHRGAKSGLERRTPLMYFSDGDNVILMASNYGRAKHPAWLYNVRANPDVTLEFRGKSGHYRARKAEGAERERLWQAAKTYIRNYADYELRAGDREIQVVVCEYVS